MLLHYIVTLHIITVFACYGRRLSRVDVILATIVEGAQWLHHGGACLL
jgi:hypothetical protein